MNNITYEKGFRLILDVLKPGYPFNHARSNLRRQGELQGGPVWMMRSLARQPLFYWSPSYLAYGVAMAKQLWMTHTAPSIVNRVGILPRQIISCRSPS